MYLFTTGLTGMPFKKKDHNIDAPVHTASDAKECTFKYETTG
jgi:hypothetical protein